MTRKTFVSTGRTLGAARFSPIALVLSSLTAAACGAPERERVERADSAGVQIVLNHAPDRELDWKFSERFHLGGADEGPEAFYEVGPWLVSVDGQGRIFALDPSNFRVVVFDSSGRHLRTVGRKGGGPGELERPAMLSVAPDGTAAVVDWGKGALVRFAPDGTPLADARFSEVGLPIGFAAQTADTVWFRVRRYGKGSLTEELVRFTGGDAQTVFELTLEVGPPIRFSCGIGLSASERIFSRGLVWHVSATRLAVSRRPGYAVDIFQGGTLAASVRRAGEPRRATREMALREVGEGMTIRVEGAGNCVVPPEEVIEKRGYADVVPAIRGIALAPDGWLWVQRYTLPGEPRKIDVFDETGAYVGTLTGRALPIAFLPNGDILERVADELGIQRLVVYRIDRS
jgi:hypothetical protein